MSCMEPGAVTPEELVAHADGQAPAHILAHLRRCPSCRAEAGSYAAWQGALRRGLHRFDCPSAHALGEYQLEVLPAEEGRRIAAHAAECPRCAEELRMLRSFLAVEPEPAVGLVDRGRRLVARLIPTPLSPAQAGLRGTASASSQTYQADGIGVALTPIPAPGTRSTGPSGWGRGAFIGLVWSEGPAGARLGGVAQLVASDGLSHEAPIDELGNFAFEDVAAGAGQLELRLGDTVVVVEDVRVGT
ncbi:MAG TPA: hypothetical protein VG370_24250 [Chloroflexota bacterium]|nr:hypothetical protein [Chloroflexota bacterium]